MVLFPVKIPFSGNPDKFSHQKWQYTLLPFERGVDMALVCLLWFFAAPGGLSANFRGNFVPPQTNPSLVEGDIAVPETHLGTGQALDAFLTEPTNLWPRGFIPYRIETFEWDGIASRRST